MYGATPGPMRQRRNHVTDARFITNVVLSVDSLHIYLSVSLSLYVYGDVKFATPTVFYCHMGEINSQKIIIRESSQMYMKIVVCDISIHHFVLMLMRCTGYSRHWNAVVYIDGLGQERRNSSALAMELPVSCTNPSISGIYLGFFLLSTLLSLDWSWSMH